MSIRTRNTWHFQRLLFSLFSHKVFFVLSGKKVGSIKKTRYELKEEQLSLNREVPIWVEAHAGNSTCTSTRTSAVLKHTGAGCPLVSPNNRADRPFWSSQIGCSILTVSIDKAQTLGAACKILCFLLNSEVWGTVECYDVLVQNQPQPELDSTRDVSSISRGSVSTGWAPRRVVGEREADQTSMNLLHLFCIIELFFNLLFVLLL